MKILDACFGNGANFLRHWARWKTERGASQALNYVAIVQSPIDLRELRAWPADSRAEEQALADELAAQCWGLLPGFHRLMFENGQVLLTLCVGDLKSQVKALRFQADHLHLPSPSLSPAHAAKAPWDLWDIKALARCCRRGTGVVCEAPSPGLLAYLHQCGFDMDPPDASAWVNGHFAPRWELKNSVPAAAKQAAKAVVIGAGLAGASVAASLARRGWQVTVLDSAERPASAASGLPVGLMLPHATSDDDPRSRLSRIGLRLTLHEAQTRLVKGQDWDDCGVLERRLDHSHGLPANWPAAGIAWSCAAAPVTGSWQAGLPGDGTALWHAHGAWVKPASLVNAWLAQPGIRFVGSSNVASIRPFNAQWALSDAGGSELARADVVILANAGGAIPLLDGLSDSMPQETGLANVLARLQTVEGQVSWAMQKDNEAPQLPPFPVNGLGSLIGHVPFAGAKAWFAGATFERNGEVLDIQGGHIANLKRVETLLPASGQLFARQLQDNEVQAWRNTRCTTTDRMPVCGPLIGGDLPGLWITSALGARGLSLSVLCGEWLAARLCGEPWPLEAKLAQSIDSMRKIH